MNIESIIDTLARIFERPDHRVAFAYLFGSTAKGETAPLSDVDVAVYLAGVRAEDFFDRKLSLHADICHALKRNDVDLVVLNNAPVVLKFQVVKDGVVLKDDHPRRLAFETAVLREYLDTKHLRDVQFQYMQEKIRQRSYFG